MSCHTSSAVPHRRRGRGPYNTRTHPRPRTDGNTNLFETLESRVLMSATNYVVDTLADTIDGSDGLTSLREAVIAANLNPGADSITFAVDGTFDLSRPGTGEDVAATGDLDITDDLTITGNGTASTIINAAGIDRVFHLFSGNTAALTNLSITGGSEMMGGGVLNGGNLTLTNAELHHNSATNGGAVFNNLFTSTLTVNDTTFHDNSASNGGAIFNNSLTNLNANTTFSDNSAANEGGAILNRSTLNISGSDTQPVTFDGNTASDGGAILNDSNLNIDRALFTNNTADEGGAIFNNNDVDLNASTFANNTAIDGGAIYNDSELIALNTTFSTNTATASGGAVYNAEDLTVTNTTLTLNDAQRGGGIYNTGSTASTLANTLAAQNTASIAGPDLAGTIITLGHNLVGNADGTTGVTNGVNGDQAGSTATPIDALLTALADNGGPTPTHALLAASPAVDAGDNTLLAPGTTTDQRGEARITDGDGDTTETVDIGAFELPEPTVIPADLTVTAVNPAAAEGNDGTTLYTFTITRSNNDADLTVDIETADGTATSGSDYVALPATTVHFSAGGDLTHDVTITVLGDEVVELDETFSVELSNPTGPANIVLGSASSTIENDDAATISIDDAAITEGDEGTSIIEFIVTLSATVDVPVNVAFMTADDSAISVLPPDFTLTGDAELLINQTIDYAADAGTITFDHTTGLTHAISVNVNGDTAAELDETFFVELMDLDAEGRDVDIIDDRASGDILRDDSGVSLEDGQLLVIGTNSSDQVTITNSRTGHIKVRTSFLSDRKGLILNEPDIEHLVLILDDGNDRLWISRKLEKPATILAGRGHDRIIAGGGPATISGGDGNDFLMGRHGNDVLIGGLGRDRLFGNSGEDILIGGTTDYDNDTDALGKILTEWLDDEPYETRLDHLRNGSGSLDGTGIRLAANDTVHDDDTTDLFIGGAHRDWYLADVDETDGDDDLLFGRHPDEVVDPLL